MAERVLTENKISSTDHNSRAAATMAAGEVFQGVGEDVADYSRVGVAITSTNATDGTLTMEVSHDGVTWGGPTRTWSNTQIAQPHMWNIVEKWFRIKYTNGSTEALGLSIQVQYSNNADILLGHQLDETLLDETEAVISRSVGVGKNPNGTYTNLEVSGVDDNNSSTTNLTAATSLVFTGTWSDISGYSGITILIDGTSDRSIKSGNLKMQFSHDGTTVHRSISIDHEDIADVAPRTLGAVAKYFRIIYTSDEDLLTFDAQVMLHTEQVLLVSRLDQELEGNEDVSNVRAVIVGAKEDGSFANVPISSDGKLQVDADVFTHLLSDLLQEQKKANRYLQLIAGFPLIDQVPN